MLAIPNHLLHVNTKDIQEHLCHGFPPRPNQRGSPHSPRLSVDGNNPSLSPAIRDLPDVHDLSKITVASLQQHLPTLSTHLGHPVWSPRMCQTFSVAANSIIPTTGASPWALPASTKAWGDLGSEDQDKKGTKQLSPHTAEQEAVSAPSQSSCRMPAAFLTYLWDSCSSAAAKQAFHPPHSGNFSWSQNSQAEIRPQIFEAKASTIPLRGVQHHSGSLQKLIH